MWFSPLPITFHFPFASLGTMVSANVFPGPYTVPRYTNAAGTPEASTRRRTGTPICAKPEGDFVNCEFEPMIPSEFGSRSSVPLIERYNGRSFGGSSFNDRRTPRVSDCRCSEIFFTAPYRNGTGT